MRGGDYKKYKLKKQGDADKNAITYYTRLFSEAAIDSGKYDIVIHGHTHNPPNITQYKGKLIVDNGCCHKEARQGALLSADGTVQLINDASVNTSY